MKYGMITDIQKFSLDDGPGIRSTVFLKGCNLRCSWCHNPESLQGTPSLEIYSDRCISCGDCYTVCPGGAMRFGISVYDSPKTTSLAPIYADRYRKYDAARCTGCGACAQACPTGALRLVGKKMSAQQVFDILRTDGDYYAASGGGVTLSGGEPTLQGDFAIELLRLCSEAGYDTAIETNLTAAFSVLESMLPYLDRIFCDFKIFDDPLHKKETGLSNRIIRENLRRLKDRGIRVVVRTPLIPGITDSDQNIAQIARWLAENTDAASYELLNYNPFAQAKHQNLRLDYALPDAKKLPAGRIEQLLELANRAGIHTVCYEK